MANECRHCKMSDVEESAEKVAVEMALNNITNENLEYDAIIINVSCQANIL